MMGKCEICGKPVVQEDPRAKVYHMRCLLNLKEIKEQQARQVKGYKPYNKWEKK